MSSPHHAIKIEFKLNIEILFLLVAVDDNTKLIHQTVGDCDEHAMRGDEK